MTDFSVGHKNKCHICGESFFEPEGKMCDCWECEGCGEEFSDFDMLGNRELMLCLHCEDERYQVEAELPKGFPDIPRGDEPKYFK